MYSNDLDGRPLLCLYASLAMIFGVFCASNSSFSLNRHSKIIHKLPETVVDVISRNIFSQHIVISNQEKLAFTDTPAREYKKSQLN